MTTSKSTDTTRVGVLPDVTDMSNAGAALAYAKAGVCVVPVRPGTKDPGSFLGKGWQHQATRDVDTVCAWWRRWPNAGIAMHVGASGFLVIDVDYPEHVPDWLWPLLDKAIFRPTTSDPTSRRGHYFFRLRREQRFGNGLGGLRPPKGRKWGEVKCHGGVVILGPSVHPRAAEGGRYATGPGGTAPELPDEIADKLNDAPDTETYRLMTPGELDAGAKAFLLLYDNNRDPSALAAIVDNFDPAPGGRHGSMYDTLCWAMREGKAGCFPAQVAHDELKHGGRALSADRRVTATPTNGTGWFAMRSTPPTQTAPENNYGRERIAINGPIPTRRFGWPSYWPNAPGSKVLRLRSGCSSGFGGGVHTGK
jgi:Bifunctional DNA primase/polymerase, N-terminal